MVRGAPLLALFLAAAVPASAASGFNLWVRKAERAGSPGETAVYYTRALESWTPAIGNRAKASALYNRGLAYHQMKYLDKAIADYTEAILLRPRNKDALLNRGVAYKQAKDFRMAVRDYTQLIDMGSKNPDVFMYRGVAFLALRQESAAVKDLSRCIRLRPNNPEAFEQRAQAYMKLGDYASAAKDYARILELMPGDTYARHNLELAKRRAAQAKSAPGRMPSRGAASPGGLSAPAGEGRPLPAAKRPVRALARALPAQRRTPAAPAIDWEKYAVPVGGGATALILVGWGLASFLGGRKAKKAGPILHEIAQAASSGGAPAPELYQRYRAVGGELRKLTAEQLAHILPDGAAEEAAGSIDAVSALRTARLLAGQGRFETAVRMLSDDVVKDVCVAGDGARQVIEMVLKAGSLDVFLARHTAGFRSPEFFASCARALLQAGEFGPALSLLTRKDPASWTPDELRDAFTLKVRLGQIDESLAMLQRVRGAFPPASNAAFYYELAQAAESPAPTALTSELYKAAAETGFQDAAQRQAAMDAALIQAQAGPQAGAQSAVEPVPAAAVPEAVPVPPAAPLPAPAGLIKGRYMLGGELGRGGMGVVFEGTDRQMGRKVALKRMHPAVRDSAEARKRFLQGAEIVSRLAHPYIVGIHDIVEEKDDIYLVFEFIDGAPLSAYLGGGKKIALPQAKGVMKHVCEAVSAAHRARVLHRDLKPGNIMVDRNGFAKVMDFDIAREAKVAISQITSKDSTGTPAYMAPEQHLGEPHRASDVFALGVTLFEMLTGQLPFKGPDFLVQKERKKYPPIRMLVSSLPEGIEPLIDELLEPDHKKRLTDPLDLLERLRVL